MEQSKIDMFLATSGKKFKPEQLNTIKEQLQNATDSQYQTLLATDFKDPTMILIIAFFLGGFGVDRFMLGQTGLGVAKLITCGGAGVWSLIDLFTAMNRAKDYNFTKFQQVL